MSSGIFSAVMPRLAKVSGNNKSVSGELKTPADEVRRVFFCVIYCPDRRVCRKKFDFYLDDAKLYMFKSDVLLPERSN